MDYGKTGSQSFPFVSVLCPSVYNKHVLHTLEYYNDELINTFQASQHISPIYSAIFHACFSIIIGWRNSTDDCISGRTC